VISYLLLSNREEKKGLFGVVVFSSTNSFDKPIPVAALSNALAGTAGSNPAGGTNVSCECCVLSVTGVCDGSIPYPEESY
jgi:hypothetical protein